MRHGKLATTAGFAVLLFAAIFLVECGGGGGEAPAPPPATEDITLKVIGEDYSPMQGLEKIKDQFTAETGIAVEISRFDVDTLRKKSIGDFQAGAANYDVIMGAFYDVGLFAANGWVLDIGAALEKPEWKDPQVEISNFSDAILDLSCRYAGKLYALPCSAQCMFLWYRKDLFENPEEQRGFREKYGYNLPQPTVEHSMTWEQYNDVAEFFTREAGASAAGEILEQNLYGTLLQGKNHSAVWFEFTNFLHSFGGRLIADDGRTVVANSPEAQRALEYYVGLKKFAPPGTVNYTWDEALTVFQAGQVAMVVNWSDSIVAVEDPEQSKVAGKVGFAAVPVVDGGETVSVFGGWGLFVNKKSQHAKEAVRFIQWANRPDVQLAWSKVGGIPATLSTYASPEYANVPGSAAHLNSLEHLVGWSTEPYSARMIAVGQNFLAQAVAGDLTPEEALNGMATGLQDIVSEGRDG